MKEQQDQIIVDFKVTLSRLKYYSSVLIADAFY